ncbi:MAG: carboxyltransferase domain-containing protein [Planctomycetes bacterium]|nr:carboxyltransferase domain-containing protein [Planctomycetota bacterium]
MRLEPLGDQAVMAYCDDESQATRLAMRIRRAMPAWCIDVVQAYVSVAIYYDGLSVDFAAVADWLADDSADTAAPLDAGRLHVIPCCYDLGLDFARIEQHTGQTRENIIRLHTGAVFTVYAIGFCPGFPYLGYVPAELAGVPRLESPRLKVEQGSVGLTGRQTGIYTEVRPGGWNIIGRTPLQLVDVKDEYFPLRTGDRVKFEAIDEAEFVALKGKRLE